MHKSSLVLFIGVSMATAAVAQEFQLPDASLADPTNLAKQVLPAYKEENRESYLKNLFALQVVAGQFSDAVKSLSALREVRRSANAIGFEWRDIQYEIYVRAKAHEVDHNSAFQEAYQRAFREVFARLDGRAAARAMPLFNIVDESWMQPALV